MKSVMNEYPGEGRRVTGFRRAKHGRSGVQTLSLNLTHSTTMSSEEDDFGAWLKLIQNTSCVLQADMRSFLETAFPSTKRNPRPKQTASKPGPSSTKPVTKAKSGQKKSGPLPRARAQTVEMEDEDDDVEMLDDGDDDVQSTALKPQVKKTNTVKATTKGKGKTKAEPKQTTSVSKPHGANGKGTATEDEDVDEDEDIRPIPRVAPLPPLTTHKPTNSNNSLVRENERLKKQIAAVYDFLPVLLVELTVVTLGYHRT